MATAFAMVMIAGSVPCTCAIVLFARLMAARLAGQPVSGDALGLMMLSLAAYAIALLSFVAGVLCFAFAARSRRTRPRAWHWGAIVYSFSQVAIPVVYFSMW